MSDWKDLAKSPDQWSNIKYNDPRLDSFANVVESKYKLPQGIIEAVKNAGERTNTGEVSGAGAQGIMQFIPATREAYPHDVADPFASIDAAGRYMSDLVKQYKNPMAAIAAYNGGGAAGKAVLEGKEPPAKETQNYLSRIKDYMNKKYGK